jgi:hypothetical protein
LPVSGGESHHDEDTQWSYSRFESLPKQKLWEAPTMYNPALYPLQRTRITMVKNVEVGCLAPHRVGPPLCEALTVSHDAKGGTFHGHTCCTPAKNLRPKVRFLKLACQSIIPPNTGGAQISGTQIGRKSYNARASLEKTRIFNPLGFRSQRGSCAQAGIGEGTDIGILTFPIPLFPPHVNQEEERQSRSHRRHNILHHPGHFMHRHRHHTGESALPTLCAENTPWTCSKSLQALKACHLH